MAWPTISLFDVCRPKQWPTIQGSDLTESGYPVYGANGRIGFYSEYNHEHRTVLITCRGATCGTINVCEPKSYVTGNAMALDDLDESQIATEYLVYALRNGSLSKAISGTAQPQITRQSLTAISIPLPPLPEQKRIAEILDRAEALRAKRRAALAQLDTLTQSIFLDLFGDPESNPKAWRFARLGEVCDLLNGVAFKSTDYVEQSNTLNCRMSNIRPSGEFDSEYNPKYLPDKFAEKYKDHILKDGDVIIAMTDMATEPKILGVPTTVISNGKTFLLNQRVGKLTIESPESLLFPFLNRLLFQPYVKRYYQRFAGGGVQINLGKSDLLSVGIILPPLSLQQEFARRAAAVEKLRTAHRQSLAELDALFAALQHRAFQGEL